MDQSLPKGSLLKRTGRHLANFVLSFTHGCLLVAGVAVAIIMAYQYTAHGIGGLDPRAWAESRPAAPESVKEYTTGVVASDKLSPEYMRLIQYIAKRHKVAGKALEQVVRDAIREGTASNIDPVLILAVTSVESGFNPLAESVFGAQGLMQIIPRFHHDKIDGSLGNTALLDPSENLRVGARILREYLRTNGAIVAALQQYGGVSDPEDLTYPNKVLNELERFRQVMKFGSVRQVAELNGPLPKVPAAGEAEADTTGTPG
ncbi:MAG: lytic transglycosylase domain-containing protein [Rhodocyclaceae bacterium]